MKALVIAREGRKAILLLPGGEMRTVRARSDWQTGMEVPVKLYSSRTKSVKIDWRSVLYPAVACVAAFLLVFGGMRLLGGGPDNRQHPVPPLSSGGETTVQSQAPEATLQPTEPIGMEPSPTPMPTAVEERTDRITVSPTPMPDIAGVDETARTDISPTPIPAPPTPHPTDSIRCDECGQAGHDDERCPNEVCDECGELGHDDDNCPNEVCDECGQTGHDDDDCPNEVCDECGQTGHDDDHCPGRHASDSSHHDD